MPNKAAIEKRLVEGCVANDRRCQEEFYRRFFNTMFGFVLRYTSDKEEAMHIVNSGYLRAFKKIELFEFKGSLEGWVRRIMFHAVSDHFRSQKTKIRFLEIEDRDKPMAASQLEPFYEEDILKMVELLPNASRRVFQLYAIEGFKHSEIAEQLGISVGTSKWHFSEARKKLKAIILKNNVFEEKNTELRNDAK